MCSMSLTYVTAANCRDEIIIEDDEVREILAQEAEGVDGEAN